jgi:hypothetical protein
MNHEQRPWNLGKMQEVGSQAQLRYGSGCASIQPIGRFRLCEEDSYYARLPLHLYRGSNFAASLLCSSWPVLFSP